MARRQADGPFTSFPDFCQRLLDEDLNKRVLESLIRAGAFDAMGVRRSQLLDAYEQLIDSLTRNRRKNLEGQFDLFSLGQEKPEPVELVLRDLPEFSQEELMTMEKEVTGLYLSGHPMDAYRDTVGPRERSPSPRCWRTSPRRRGPHPSSRHGQRILLAGVVAAAKTKTTKNNSLMAYVTLEDDTGSLELLVFSRVLEESGSYLQVNLPILTEGRISVRDEKAPQLMCDRVHPLSQVRNRPALPLPSPGSSICALPGATIPCSPGYATSLSSSPASRPPCTRGCSERAGPVPAPPRPAPGAERAAGGGKCGAPMTLRPLHKKGLPSL
mgnify:CR=1 FL=1